AMPLRVRSEGRKVDDGEFRNESLKLGPLRANEQLANEQRVPRVLGEDACLDLVFRVGATVKILRKKLPAFRVLEEVGKKIVEALLRHFAIAVPPDGIFGQRVDDSVLVLRAAAGVVTGLRAECATRDDRSFTRGDGMLVEQRLGQVPVDCGEIFETEFVSAISAVPHTLLLHANSSQLSRFNNSLAGSLGPAGGSLSR